MCWQGRGPSCCSYCRGGTPSCPGPADTSPAPVNIHVGRWRYLVNIRCPPHLCDWVLAVLVRTSATPSPPMAARASAAPRAGRWAPTQHSRGPCFSSADSSPSSNSMLSSPPIFFRVGLGCSGAHPLSSICYRIILAIILLSLDHDQDYHFTIKIITSTLKHSTDDRCSIIMHYCRDCRILH